MTKIRLSSSLYIILFIFLTCQSLYAHEPWLLTNEQITDLNSRPYPQLFSQPSFFNVIVLTLTVLVIIGWIVINNFLPEKKYSFSHLKQNIVALSMRLGVGTTLVMQALGMLPKLGVPHFVEPTLLAPEFILSHLQGSWMWLAWVELTLGMGFIFGLSTRLCSIFLLFLLGFAFFKFGMGVMQYSGFYLAIIIYLFMQGGGEYSLTPERKKLLAPQVTLCVAQILTGLNFLYSTISIKYLQPNLDIGMLQINTAFTFGIPYDYFTFLMLMTEMTLGILLILGYRLAIVSAFLVLLFIFLSIDLGENFLAHNFIYGILIAFIIQGGYPLHLKK